MAIKENNNEPILDAYKNWRIKSFELSSIRNSSKYQQKKQN